MSPRHPSEPSARLGATAHLLGLRLSKLDARQGAAAFDDGVKSMEVELAPNFWLADDGSMIVYTFEFVVRMKTGRRLALKVTAEYEIAFSIPSAESFDADELIAFGDTTARRVVHPYLRQQVHALTLAFGLAPAVMDLVRISLADPMSSP